MSEADLDAVVEIERTSFSTPWTRGLLESEFSLEHSSGFVLVEDDLLVGYVFARLVAGELHIVNLAVHRSRRRTGYGTRLLKFICEYGFKMGCGVCYLEVRTTNLPAVRLYQKSGFRIIRRRARYYEDGSDAYVMGASLKEILAALGTP